MLLHSSTLSALRAYERQRDQVCPPPAAPTFFVSARGTVLHPRRVNEVFARLVAQAGIEGRSGRHRGPGLKDLRHAFAIATVIGWYQAGVDVAAHMPLLSTWMGHRDQASTFWYLQANPQLLALAAELMAGQARQDLS